MADTSADAATTDTRDDGIGSLIDWLEDYKDMSLFALRQQCDMPKLKVFWDELNPLIQNADGDSRLLAELSEAERKRVNVLERAIVETEPRTYWGVDGFKDGLARFNPSGLGIRLSDHVPFEVGQKLATRIETVGIDLRDLERLAQMLLESDFHEVPRWEYGWFHYGVYNVHTIFREITKADETLPWRIEFFPEEIALDMICRVVRECWDRDDEPEGLALMCGVVAECDRISREVGSVVGELKSIHYEISLKLAKQPASNVANEPLRPTDAAGPSANENTTPKPATTKHKNLVTSLISHLSTAQDKAKELDQLKEGKHEEKPMKLKSPHYIGKDDDVPAKFRDSDGNEFGPLTGNETELAFAVTNGESEDNTQLQVKAGSRVVCVRQLTDRSFEVFARNQRELDNYLTLRNERRLKVREKKKKRRKGS